MSLPQLIDIRFLSALRDSLSVITDLSFSLYDGAGMLLVLPEGEDKLTAYMRSYSRGREELEEFILHGIEKAAMRKDSFLSKGPVNEHRLFISAGIENFKIVFVSNPFYSTRAEFEEFLIKNGKHFGLSPANFEAWIEAVKIKDCSTVQNMAAHIKPILEIFLQRSYRKHLNHKSYRWSETLTDVAFSTQLPKTAEGVYVLVLDAIMFLFNVDTVSVMIKDGNLFRVFLSTGRLRNDVKTLCVEDRNRMISKAIEDRMPVYTDDVTEILRLGFPEKMTSVYIYPLLYSSTTYGVVVIYNSMLSAEESCSIMEFCKLMSLVLKNVSLQSDYDRCSTGIGRLQMTTTQHIPQFHSLKEIPVTDPVTGLFGRQYFQERFIEEIHRSERYDISFSFAVTDIDNFSSFNDSEERLKGDNILREIAKIMHGSVRGYDILSRLGGREFGILMPQTASGEAFMVAERIRKNIKAALMKRWTAFPFPGITVSIGISSFPHNGKSFDELIESADVALCKAKSMGKDRTVIYSD
jgi:diguanylate cyclase (GGDEF)-like protein